jgi:hypothetical protein
MVCSPFLAAMLSDVEIGRVCPLSKRGADRAVNHAVGVLSAIARAGHPPVAGTPASHPHNI